MTLKNAAAELLALRFLWRLILTVSVIAIIYLATTDRPHTIQTSVNDKFNHLLAFTELAVLTRLSWPQIKLATSALLLMGFGILIELVQAPLSYREFSVLDLGADALGIALGLTIAWLLERVAGSWKSSGQSE